MIERVCYSTYDYGRYLGTYSVSELQAMIHCGVQVPGAYANAGRPYRGRYMFERIDGRGGQSAASNSAGGGKMRAGA